MKAEASWLPGADAERGGSEGSEGRVLQRSRARTETAPVASVFALFAGRQTSQLLIVRDEATQAALSIRNSELLLPRAVPTALFNHY